MALSAHRAEGGSFATQAAEYLSRVFGAGLTITIESSIMSSYGSMDPVLSNGLVKQVKHKRRYCRAEGCTRIVKSQGLCQRHGAKPRKCKVEGCEKQAQGNFDGMCT